MEKNTPLTRVLRSIAPFVAVLFLVSLVFTCPAGAAEKPYPNKSIKVIVPFPPGGPVDQAARIVSDELAKELGVTVTIDYKPGAGGVSGSAFVASANPDGYTLLVTASGPIVGSPVMEKCPYDPLTDFTPLAFVGISPNILAGHTSSNLATYDDVVKFAKAKPGVLTCATSGVGTTSHLMLELMKMHGVNITHVPAKGAAPSLTNVLGRHVDFAILLYPPLLPHVKSGKLRLLITTNKLPQEKGLPTMAEKGMPEGEALGAWEGVLAPKNLPKPVLDRLTAALQKVSQQPSVVSGLERAGFNAEYLGPDGFRKRIQSDYSVMKKIAQAAGLAK